ncbi:MAG: response regulator [Planctomycetota bacterium]|jgi:DNA-binding NtrC family response regulator
METNIKKPVILVVDDEPDMCEMLSELLSDEGYKLETATNGKDAVKKVLGGSVDIVLLDIMMPGQDGIDTLRQIKDIRPKLPVVMITGFGTLSTARNAMKLGAYDYITKPFNIDCIKEIIKQGLEEQD